MGPKIIEEVNNYGICNSHPDNDTFGICSCGNRVDTVFLRLLYPLAQAKFNLADYTAHNICVLNILCNQIRIISVCVQASWNDRLGAEKII